MDLLDFIPAKEIEGMSGLTSEIAEGSETAFRDILSRYQIRGGADLRILPYALPNELPVLPGAFLRAYLLDGIATSMAEDAQFVKLLHELAARAQQDRTVLFVLTDNDTFNEETMEVIGPKAPAWIAFEEWLLSIGWSRLGETETGIATMVGVDYRATGERDRTDDVAHAASPTR